METEAAGDLLFCRPRPIVPLSSLGRRGGREPIGLVVRAEVRWKHGGSFAIGTLIGEAGALVFRGDAFDFRLTAREIPMSEFGIDPIERFLRGLRLRLPGEEGSLVLRLGIEDRYREELRGILSNLTMDATAILPPLYLAADPASGAEDGNDFTTVGAVRPLWSRLSGRRWSERVMQRAGERAFRRLQTLAPPP